MQGLPPSLSTRYVRVGHLGEGGMGTVLSCFDRELRRDVAIKLLREELVRPGDRERFAREAMALSRLSVPGVVRIFDAGTADGTAYLVMERLRGRPLARELEGATTLPEPRVAHLLSALLAALAEVHEAGLLHRDIKPSNIWLREDDEPVLLDFGLARAVDRPTGLTTSGAVVGTLRFMGPEILLGGGASPLTDLWALGLTALECLVDVDVHTGGTRYRRTPEKRICESIVRGQYVEVAQRALDRGTPLQKLVLAAIAFRPDARPASARAMLKELQQRDVVGEVSAKPAGGGTEVLPGKERTPQRHPPGSEATTGSRTLPARAATLVRACSLLVGAIAGLALWVRPTALPVGAPARPPPATAARRPPPAPRSVPAALAALRPARLHTELRTAVARRPRIDRELGAFVTGVISEWSPRLDEELAFSGLEAAARVPAAPDAATLEERMEHYRLSCEYWLLDGQCRDLGVAPGVDARALFPRAHRPVTPQPLQRAESIGIRWRLKADHPLALGPTRRLVPPAIPGEKRFYTDEGSRGLVGMIYLDKVRERLSYEEPAPLPWRRPRPDERVFLALSGKRIGLTSSFTVSFSKDGTHWSVPRVRFRGERPEQRELWHEIDPELVDGPVRVRLDFHHTLGLHFSGDAHVYGLALHYVPR